MITASRFESIGSFSSCPQPLALELIRESIILSRMSRPAKQSAEVIRLVQEAPGPRSANEIWGDMRGSGVGLATVYRALKRGVESGRLRAVELGGGPPRFEPADREHHHHFLCSGCDRAFDVEGCVPGIDRLLPANFSANAHEILLFGRCADCQETA